MRTLKLSFRQRDSRIFPVHHWLEKAVWAQGCCMLHPQTELVGPFEERRAAEAVPVVRADGAPCGAFSSYSLQDWALISC